MRAVRHGVGRGTGTKLPVQSGAVLILKSGRRQLSCRGARCAGYPPRRSDTIDRRRPAERHSGTAGHNSALGIKSVDQLG